MKNMKVIYNLFLVLFAIMFVSCDKQLTQLNVNPNGVDPETVNPNLILATVISNTAKPYLEMGFDGDVAGVMQYVQKSGWSSGLNKFDWVGERSWGGPYANLRNAKHLYERALEENMEFQQGVAIVLRAFNFGYIADSWGDAPYTYALNAPAGGQEDMFPEFDSQEDIYRGIIDELKNANTLLSKQIGDYKGIDPDADLIYHGDPAKWRKFANSLMLRYYLRVSSKLPDYAKQGIEQIVNDPGTYPFFESNDDDATMGFVGSYEGDAWPNAIAFDASESNFNRVQLCEGFRDELVALNDPRIGVWFNKVRVPIKVSTAHSPAADIVVDGVRYIHPDSMAVRNWVVYNKDTWVDDINAGKVLVDTMDYVGIPVGSSVGDGSSWNLNPNVIQGGFNVHCSALADMYKEAKGDLLKARLVSYAEVCFILAEAAQKGWNVGTQQDWYEKGVTASFDTWGVSDDLSAYLSEEGVAYDGSLQQIMEQKWIANWTVAHEAWCDWRRTGLPYFTFGPTVRRDAMPIRFRYGGDEKNRNNANYLKTVNNLEETSFTAQDGKDSSWSRFWLLQGTGKPY
ncbi:MAG: SusD/RagB family nutrient-binding outer membrane lipoprotein [Bacteroidales bacterium]|nr:SusD/RagB family nutrient-binding outer membrane lipoprotein [Bacteroidales bacterium]